MDAGVDELFLQIGEDISLAELLKELGERFGGVPMSHSDGFVCLFDDMKGPVALKPHDSISPGSTLLFLGTVESG